MHLKSVQELLCLHLDVSRQLNTGAMQRWDADFSRPHFFAKNTLGREQRVRGFRVADTLNRLPASVRVNVCFDRISVPYRPRGRATKDQEV